MLQRLIFPARNSGKGRQSKMQVVLCYLLWTSVPLSQAICTSEHHQLQSHFSFMSCGPWLKKLGLQYT